MHTHNDKTGDLMILHSIENIFIYGWSLDFPLFRWYVNVFYQTCYHGESSGLWSSSPPVVIRYRLPDTDAPAKYKQTPIFQGKAAKVL
jgi:hypothetical protein